MRVERYPNAAAFLAATGPYLLQSEVENNLILGIAQDLVEAPASMPAPYFAAVLDASIQICAFRTLPHKLGITRCARPEALALLAQDACAAGPTIREVVGPEPTATAFLNHLAPLLGARITGRMAQRIHQLEEVQPLDDVPRGRFRAAGPSDLDLVTSWVEAFLADVGDAQGDPRELAATRVAAGRLFLWDDNGPVTMAAWTGKTVHGVRINLVYTPPPARKRGYATACVAALSRHLLQAGNRYCCLYTDLANPTSNAIYRRIGYRVVSDSAMYTITV